MKTGWTTASHQRKAAPHEALGGLFRVGDFVLETRWVSGRFAEKLFLFRELPKWQVESTHPISGLLKPETEAARAISPI